MITIQTYLKDFNKLKIICHCYDNHYQWGNNSSNFFTVEVSFRKFRSWVRGKGYLDLKLVDEDFRIGIVDFVRNFLDAKIMNEFIQEYQELTI